MEDGRQLIKKYLIFVTLLLTFSLFSPFLLQAQLNEEKVKLDLNFIKKDWEIAITEFKDRGVTPDQTHLLKIIPILLYERILPCKEHQLTDKERDYLASNFFEDKILSLQKRLSDEQKQFDQLFFDRNATQQTKNSKSSSIRKLYLELEEYRSQKDNLSLVQIQDSFPINLIKNNEESPIFPPITINIADFIKEKNLDMLITGSIEQIEGLIFYTIEIYSAGSIKPVFTIQKGGEYQEIQDLALKDSNIIVEKILGRPWASLFFETKPMTAAIHFNDGAKGVGIVNRVYITPGNYSVRLNAPGYLNEEVEIVLKPNDEANFKYQMQKDLATPVVLQSFPSGADVYLSSEWKGKTPLLLQNAGNTEPFVVRLENYTDYYGNIDDIENSILNFELNSSKFINEDLLLSKRKDMYNSITMLALGVPFFLFGFGFDAKWAESEKTNFPSGPIMDNRFDKNYFDISTTRNGLGLLSQTGVSIFAMGIVNMFIDMVEYVSIYDKM